jgi:glycosyltransferase involved in cell wall biosynthesis
MLISIIIPNYNHAPFLKRRIQSVLNQTYQNFEVIILDDKSTDESREIIEGYRSHPKIIHIEYNEINSGSTFKQWQKGLDLAQGEWIWIAESDDIADPEFLDSLIKEISLNTAIVFCRSKLIDEEENPITLYNFTSMPDPRVYSEFAVNFDEAGDIFTKKFMLNMNAIPNASSAIFKKSLVNETIFNDAGKTKLFGDWLFWLHLLKQGDISYVSHTYNHFRYHQNTVRKDTLHSSVRLMEYMILVKFLEKNFSLVNEALDCLLFLYLSGDIPFSRLSIKEHLKLNTFVLRRRPVFLLKSYLRKIVRKP